MKKLIIGVISLLALALITIYVYRSQQSSTIRGELTDFAVKDTASIDRIVLKDESGETVDLKRMPDGSWKLNDKYTARQDAVETLIYTIGKVSVKAPVGQQNMQSVLKNIIANHVLVEIYQGGSEPSKSYYVGGPDESHTGTNMLMKSSNRPFVMHIEGFHGFLTPRYFTSLNEWRHRGVFEYTPGEIRSVEVSYKQNPERNFRIEATEGGQYQVFQGEKMDPVSAADTLLVEAYLSSYQMIHYESYEETKNEAFIDSVKASEPMFTISLVTTTGENRTVHGYRKPMKGGEDMEGNPIDYDLDRLYIWVDSSEFLVAQYVIFDKLTKGTGFINSR